MHAVRLIGKLAPKAVNYTSTGGGSSLDIIDWRDAAHALTGMNNPDAVNWALYRFAGQEEKRSRVIRSLSMTIAMFVKIRRFKIKPETLNGIIEAAVFEFELPICGVCDGSGFMSNSNVCKPCGGKGRDSISKRKRAQIIGIDHKSYSQNHDEVTKELMRMIATWEQQIIKNVNQKMEDAA